MRLALISLLMIPLVVGCGPEKEESDASEEADCCGGDNPPWECGDDGTFESGERSCQGDDFSEWREERSGWSRIVECQPDGTLKEVQVCQTVYNSSYMAGCILWSYDESPVCDFWDEG